MIYFMQTSMTSWKAVCEGRLVATIVELEDEAEINHLSLRVSSLESRVNAEPTSTDDSYMAVECPRCHAEAGSPCVTSYGSKPGTELRYIHAPRVDVGYAASRPQ